MMNPEKRKALEAAGWKFGDAADFLEMTDEERQILDFRMQAALALRQLREANHLSQKELASRMKTSQPRIAKIEQAAPDVSLDQIFRAYVLAGGRIALKGKKTKRRITAKGKPAKRDTVHVDLDSPG